MQVSFSTRVWNVVLDAPRLVLGRFCDDPSQFGDGQFGDPTS